MTWFKNNKGLVLSALSCLLPMVFSLAVYGELPDQVAIHWNGQGVADGYAHKAMAAFGLPLILMGLHVVSQIKMSNDPKRAGSSPVMQAFMTWLIPALSIILVPVTLLIAMGAQVEITLLAPVIVGLVLMIAGNYLPKSRQNYTIGIKLPWTLHSAEVWNKTHRLAGYLYLAGGMVLVCGAFVLRGTPGAVTVLTLGVLACLALLPTLYAYYRYQKEQRTEHKGDME